MSHGSFVVAASLLLGVTAAAARDWTEEARMQPDPARTERLEQGGTAEVARSAQPVAVVKAWALFPPEAAKRGLPKEPRGGH